MKFEEIMAFNHPYNQKNFDKLIEAIQSRQVIPYIGAGMSMLFKDVYPSWGDFLNTTSEEYLGNKEKVRFEELDNYEEKADFLYEEIGATHFSDHLISVFGEHHLKRDSKEFVDKAAYLIPLIFNKGLIITTNYDVVIEKNFTLHGETISVAHPGHYEILNRSLSQGQLVLYKIHGDINEPETTIVLTTEKYNEVYSSRELIGILKHIYSNKSLLFLGCSLEKDRPLELLERAAKPGMRYYGIVQCSDEKRRDRRLELDKKYHLESILYPKDQHECVRIILERILEIVAPEAYPKLKEAYLEKNEVTNLSHQLTEEWFENQNDTQIKYLGDRYLPELHVELSLSNMFNALGRNEEFKHHFREKIDEVLTIINKQEIEEVRTTITSIEEIIHQFSNKANESLDIEILQKHFERISEVLDNRIKVNKKMLDDKECKEWEKIKTETEQLNQTQKKVHEYTKYLYSKEIKAANTPYILLHGTGGMGKSHILAHTIEKRKINGYKSLLFLGQHFKSDKMPIKCMLEILEIKCSFEELLETLNEIGEKDQQRVIFFIDALNEGQGKEIWKDYLSGVVEKIKKYPWLGLVTSIRSEYIPSLMDNNSKLTEILISVEHKGFSTIEYKAIKKYFDFYGIHYSDIPMPNQEFRNPLFLRLTCEAFKGNEIKLDTISFTDIYKNYLKTLNLRIAEACRYSRHINLVTEVLNGMVKYKYEKGIGDNLIPICKCIEIIIGIANKYKINHSVIDELLAIGVINKTIDSADEEYMHVTYEKLEDYVYVKLLVEELKEIGIGDFLDKHKNLIWYGDILEVLAIVLSEEAYSMEIPHEIFELFESKEKNHNIISAFISALKWRKTSTITEKTLDYIKKIVLRQNGYEVDFYNVLILISTKANHLLNANCMVEHIIQKAMPDRDACFIPIFNEIYAEEEESINRLLGWCFDTESSANTSSETIRLAAIMISTFLISSNRSLRDESTKALVSLLTGKIDIVIAVLERFEKVDDPYILERLYAVAFGCVVSEQSEEMIEKLAVYAYEKIFDVDYVYPNILLRDYAKNIVDYAKYKLSSPILEAMSVEPPYISNFPKVPTDEEIEEYEYDYNAEDFQDYYWSQNAILSSMKVEYTRDGQPGGYGDFGRYTFQSYFSSWKGLDYNDLKNIAIKKIFDMGYDVEKHGRFDRNVPNNRGTEKIYERIGKKYQWIALYELAAQVADNYKMEVHTDSYSKKEKIYCEGAFEPDIRNIDPTALLTVNRESNNGRTIHNHLFQFSSITNHKWLENFNDLPSINDMIHMVYKNQEFILLNGWYIWKEEKALESERYQNPQKDMWVLINSYIVKAEQLEAIVNELREKDFMGRWLVEPNKNNTLYNKEYYWGNGYYFFQNPYYCGEEWTQIDKYEDKLDENYQVLLPICEYTTERQGDIFQEGVENSWHKPCRDLFYGLQLKYGQGNSILYNDDGEIMCFESSELVNENIGFFIKKENFLQYLKQRGYSVLWTILAEKRIIGVSYNDREYGQPNISGVYTLNEEGKFVGETVENE